MKGQQDTSRIRSETDTIPATEVADVLHAHAGWTREATVTASTVRQEWNQRGCLPGWAIRFLCHEKRSHVNSSLPLRLANRTRPRQRHERRCAKRIVSSTSSADPSHLAKLHTRCEVRLHFRMWSDES